MWLDRKFTEVDGLGQWIKHQTANYQAVSLTPTATPIYLILFFVLIKIHNIPFANKNAESISQEDTYIYTQYQ